MKYIKRTFSYLLCPVFFFLCCAYTCAILLDCKHKGKFRALIDRFVVWNDTVLMK